MVLIKPAADNILRILVKPARSAHCLAVINDHFITCFCAGHVRSWDRYNAAEHLFFFDVEHVCKLAHVNEVEKLNAYCNSDIFFRSSAYVIVCRAIVVVRAKVVIHFAGREKYAAHSFRLPAAYKRKVFRRSAKDKRTGLHKVVMAFTLI